MKNNLTTNGKLFQIYPIMRRYSSTVDTVTPTSHNGEQPQHHYAFFDHNQPRYKTCFGKVHITTLAKLILMIELLGNLASCVGLSCLIALNQPVFYFTFMKCVLVACILSIVFASLALLSIRRKKENILIIEISFQILMCAVFVLFAVFCFQQIETDSTTYSILAACSILGFVLQLYFAYVIYRTFHYLKDLNVYLLYSS